MDQTYRRIMKRITDLVPIFLSSANRHQLSSIQNLLTNHHTILWSCSGYHDRFLSNILILESHLEPSNQRCNEAPQLSSCESLSDAASWTVKKCHICVIVLYAARAISLTIAVVPPIRVKLMRI